MPPLKRVSHFFVSLFEEMMTHLILSHSVTCHPPHALSIWQLRARKAKDHGCCVRHSGEVGGRQAKCMMCISTYEYVRMCLRMTVCVHVCQSEGMDACQRREQHHVRVLADDAHFRYTNSNSQLSHETISSHDSSTPFLSASCVSASYCKVKQQSYLSLSANFWLSGYSCLQDNRYRASEFKEHMGTAFNNYTQTHIHTYLFYYNHRNF